MSSGEAPRSSAAKANQNGMAACPSSERRGALHPQHHFKSPQLSGGMEDLSKKQVQIQHLSHCLLLPCFRSSLPRNAQQVRQGRQRGEEWRSPGPCESQPSQVRSWVCTQTLQLWLWALPPTGGEGEQDRWELQSPP